MSDTVDRPIPPLIFMGVSGAGKTTVGSQLAEILGGQYLDADDYHPAANKEIMRQGIPLTDEDRLPWLQAVGAAASRVTADGALAVVACSSLKKAHRDILRLAVPSAVFIHLHGQPDIIRARMAGRQHEFMPDTLLDSQFRELELPTEQEEHIHVEISSVDMDVTAEVLRLLKKKWTAIQ